MLRDMADQMRHRGPNGEGFHLTRNAAIGMRRLSIIDLNGGWQPLYNEDRTIALVCNGEIYNFPELRESLKSRGHQFATSSDCETIVHLYEDYGVDCVHHLRGMFAFALIDERKQRALLARDRMGEKPLSLVERDGSLVFSNELRALVGAGVVPFEMDPDAIRSYYYWNFVPEPASALQGVRKLPGGSYLDIDLRTGQQREVKYWRLTDSPPVSGEPIERLRAKLDSVGRSIIRSDVPIGIGLSGGIDSSAIAALAKRHTSRPVTGFTVGYDGHSFQDEREAARQFAKHIDIPFAEIRLGVDRVVDEFPMNCLCRDDPLADPSAPSVHALMRLSRDHDVPVMLTGHGGDELFWGYQWLRDSVEHNERKCALLAGKAGLVDYLGLRKPPISLTGLASWFEGGSGLLDGLRAYRRDRRTSAKQLVFWDIRSEFQDGERHLVAASGLTLRMATAPSARVFTGAKWWADIEMSMTQLVCDTYLQSNGLVLSDRLSMANSVEARTPLVDYRLAELIIGLRKTRSDLSLGHKARLKGALSDLVPPFVFKRRKRGFTPPWRKWTRALMGRYGEDMATGVLVDRGIIRRDAAERFAGGFDWLHRPMPLAFPTLVLEQWARGMVGLERDARDRFAHRSGEPDLSEKRESVPNAA